MSNIDEYKEEMSKLDLDKMLSFMGEDYRLLFRLLTQKAYISENEIEKEIINVEKGTISLHVLFLLTTSIHYLKNTLSLLIDKVVEKMLEDEGEKWEFIDGAPDFIDLETDFIDIECEQYSFYRDIANKAKRDIMNNDLIVLMSAILTPANEYPGFIYWCKKNGDYPIQGKTGEIEEIKPPSNMVIDLEKSAYWIKEHVKCFYDFFNLTQKNNERRAFDDFWKEVPNEIKSVLLKKNILLKLMDMRFALPLK